MEKLNVCLINDSFPPAIDGVANAVTNYAKIIAQSYGNPTVVTPFYPDADDAAFPFPRHVRKYGMIRGARKCIPFLYKILFYQSGICEY